MPGYDLLSDVTVIEVAQLGMSTLGGHLADMGANVIKVESLPSGDPVRFAGEHAIGASDGVGFLHLRWNRGKQSIGLDLRDAEGAEIFRDLVARADIVIEGLKAGALDRLGLGYAGLSADRPELVYCSISGLGSNGPYHKLRSHASAYDAYAGLLPKDVEGQPPALGEFKPPSIGMNAPGLYAAIGVLSAMHKAKLTGIGSHVEVAAIDAALCFTPDKIEPELNPDTSVLRPSHLDATGRMREWPRLWHYTTRDGRVLHLEVLSDGTWHKFCRLIERPDLLTLRERTEDDNQYNAVLKNELAAIIRSQDLHEWMDQFVQHDISAMPVNSPAEVPEDQTFIARQSYYDSDVAGAGRVRLLSSPVLVDGQDFAPSGAPALGEHTERILRDILGKSPKEIMRLRASSVVC